MAHGDLFETLPDPLICIIISFLTFKEAARTSILAKRWRHLWRSTKTIEFNERFFIKPADPQETRENQRSNFIDFATQWIKSYKDNSSINHFSLTISNPKDQLSLPLLDKSIPFSLSRKAKSLRLDFTDPAWEQQQQQQQQDHLDNHPLEAIDLPSNVYEHGALESLELFSCKFDMSELVKLRNLKHVSLGWVRLLLSSLKALLSNCVLLESLSLVRCWDIDHVQVKGTRGRNLKLKSLVIENCDFNENWLEIEAPRLKYLKYNGMVSSYFDVQVAVDMEEADLDFRHYDGQAILGLGDVLLRLLNLLNPTKLTLCSYFLQGITSGENRKGTSLDVKHLKLKTRMHNNEGWGINFMIYSCPTLETLIIDIGSPANRILQGFEAPYNDENITWRDQTFGYVCIKRTLKVFEIKGFKGYLNESYIVKNVIKYGRVMEKLNIYISNEVDHQANGMNPEGYIRTARDILAQTRKASPLLQISIFTTTS